MMMWIQKKNGIPLVDLVTWGIGTRERETISVAGFSGLVSNMLRADGLTDKVQLNWWKQHDEDNCMMYIQGMHTHTVTCMKWFITHRLWSCNLSQRPLHPVDEMELLMFILPHTKLSTCLSIIRKGARVCIQVSFKLFEIITTEKVTQRVVQGFVYIIAVTQYQWHFVSWGKEWVVSYCTSRHAKQHIAHQNRVCSSY